MTIRVRKQGSSVLVLGTEDASEACRAAGISPETHRWCCTDFGHFVLRDGTWRLASEPPYRPADAEPGVRFVGPIHELQP